MNTYSQINPFTDDDDTVNVIVDTPKGSSNKYSFDEEAGVFELSGVLTLGHSFPYNFGFIPNTLGGDGDPLDVLVITDEAAFCGCLVKTRLIGVIEAVQTERNDDEQKNDRLIGVAAKSPTHEALRSLADLSAITIEQIEHFFTSYNEAKGKKFEVTGRASNERALEVVRRGIEDHQIIKKS
jgi:inorganic pyrophosphatase